MIVQRGRPLHGPGHDGTMWCLFGGAELSVERVLGLRKENYFDCQGSHRKARRVRAEFERAIG
eukprot:NODE_12029_length_1250_cov_3.943900.p6 GENE.NODE_12029_length_1250_cov_3.943900~~NODE_12029_length_1250_cov_3.943900.p6  ORF type:complete len:63 (+),score=5.81 NODE_12029_length_1250_cov_3.943900:202-390(+)